VKRSRLIITFLILLLISITASSCKPTGKKAAGGSESRKIKVAYHPVTIEYNLLVDLAEKKGFFKEENIEVEKVLSESQTTPILLSGRAEVALVPVETMIGAFLNKKKIKLLGITSTYPSRSYLISRFPKEKLSSVRKVGVNKIGGADQLLMSSVFDNIGIDKKKVEYVIAQQSQGKSAFLIAKKIDIGMIQEGKFRKELVKKKYYELNPKEVFKSLQFPRTIVASQKALNEKGEAIESFVKAIHKSLVLIRENKKEAIAYIKSKLDVPENAANGIYADVLSGLADSSSFIPNTEILKDSLSVVKEEVKPSNPSRNLDELIFVDYAKAASAD